MSAHLPACARLLLVFILVLQAVLPVQAAAAPPIAARPATARAEPAPAPVAQKLSEKPSDAVDAIHRLKLTRPHRAWNEWLRPLLSFSQVFFNPWSRWSAQDITSASALTSTSASPFTSPLPTPPPTPVSARGAPLALAMQAAPAWAAAGETVAFTVTAANTGRALLSGLVLRDTLPAGLVYVAQSATGFAYTADDQRLTWQPAPLAAGTTITGSFQARVHGLALGATVTNTVSAAAAGWASPVTANARLDIAPPAADAAWADAAGGWLRSTDGRVLLRVPPAAVGQRVRFSYAAAREVPQPPPGLRFAFRLEAQAERGQAVRQFAIPLDLKAAHGLRAGGPLLTLFRYDTDTERWSPVAASLVRERGIVTASIEQIGLLAVASDPTGYEFDPGPRVRGAQPQLFSGSIGFTYPFVLPPGRGGLAPQLGLTYSSSRHEREMGHFSMIGHGWDILGQNYVSRDPRDPGGQPITLVLNGAPYTIDTTTWVAKEDPFVTVTDLEDGPQYGFWVKTRDGTRYHFRGDRNLDASHNQFIGAPPSCTHGGPATA